MRIDSCKIASLQFYIQQTGKENPKMILLIVSIQITLQESKEIHEVLKKMFDPE